MSVAVPPLEPLFGKSIALICPFSIGRDDAQSHCAHFVSHIMGYEFAETCKNYTLKDKQGSDKGATLRVEKLFNACIEKGPWTARPARLTPCLIFVTVSSNVVRSGDQLTMRDLPQKHVGIFAKGLVWELQQHAKEGTGRP